MADPVILPIALIATLACFVLNLWSGTRIGRARQRIGHGHADAAAMLAARHSAAASFHGNALFFLLLLALLELAGANPCLLAAASIAFVGARSLLIATAGAAAGGRVRRLGVTITLLAQAILIVIAFTLAIGARPGPSAQADRIDAAA